MQPNNNNGQNPEPVMDIQRPTSSNEPKNSLSSSMSDLLNRPATMEYTRPRQDGDANSATTNETARIPSVQPQVKSKKSHKGLVIGLVLFLLIGASGAGAYYYFVMAKEKPAPVTQTQESTNEQTPQTENTEKIEATPEGLDSASKAIDDSLNSVDDTKDFNSEDINDKSLGIQ